MKAPATTHATATMASPIMPVVGNAASESPIGGDLGNRVSRGRKESRYSSSRNDPQMTQRWAAPVKTVFGDHDGVFLFYSVASGSVCASFWRGLSLGRAPGLGLFVAPLGLFAITDFLLRQIEDVAFFLAVGRCLVTRNDA